MVSTSTSSTDNNTISIQPKYVTIYDIEKNDDDNNNNSYSTSTPTKGYVPVAKYDDNEHDVHIIAEPIVNESSLLSLTNRRRHTNIKNKRRTTSCCCICGYITLTLFILFISFFVVLGIVSYTMIAKGIQVITVDTPIDFPIVNVYEKEMEQVINNINTFFDAILNMEDDNTNNNNNEVIHDLIIPSKFVNGAITHSDYLRGHAYVTMKPNEFILQTSLPMNMLPGGKDRYFVSTLDTTIVSHDTMKEQDKDDDFVLYTNTANKIITTFDLGKKINDNYDGPLFIIQLLMYFDNQNMNHEWIANLQSIKFMGNEVVQPGQEKINLLQNLYDSTKTDPTCIKIMNGIESIRIEQDQIIIHATNQPNGIISSTTSVTSSTSASISSETGTDDVVENEKDMNSNNIEVITDIYDMNEEDSTSTTTTTTTSMTTTSSSSNNNNSNSETMNTNHIPLLFLRQRKI